MIKVEEELPIVDLSLDIPNTQISVISSNWFKNGQENYKNRSRQAGYTKTVPLRDYLGEWSSLSIDFGIDSGENELEE